jgi:hypothetical protein
VLFGGAAVRRFVRRDAVLQGKSRRGRPDREWSMGKSVSFVKGRWCDVRGGYGSGE